MNKGYVFGPVPSRRLGFSLGIDPIPYKTCSLDCIYCQLGRTTNKTMERKEYVSSNSILEELAGFLTKDQKIDYVTLSGSGEPTLNSKIREIIKGIKTLTNIPVAVLTNGTLLFQEKVREDLLEADLVIPSLDAATPETFQRINRPHSSLKIEQIIEGLKIFKRKFKGEIWLEVMLVKGINDSSKEIEEIRKAIQEINPDRVQLNTVVRPPAEESAKALSPKELKTIRGIFGNNCEIILEFLKKNERGYEEGREKAIVGLIKRRPVTLLDISRALGMSRNEVVKYLGILEEKGEIKSKIYCRARYYEPA